MTKTVEALGGSVIEWTDELEFSFYINGKLYSEIHVKPPENSQMVFFHYPYHFHVVGYKNRYTMNKRLLKRFLQYAKEFIVGTKQNHITNRSIRVEVFRRFFETIKHDRIYGLGL